MAASIPIPVEADTRRERQVRTVALIGPPNSGKSTLFNRLTRLRQSVGNYPGITVEHRSGIFTVAGKEIRIIDLPGVYSLAPYSEDERVAVDVLTGRMPGVSPPDAVLLVLDATNLSRQLPLASAVLGFGLPTLVLLNMADLFARRGGEIDILKLARELASPVALVSATKGTGLDAIDRFLESKPGPGQAVTLPVLQAPSQNRSWASQLGRSAGYRAPLPAAWTRRLDALVLHKIWGPLIFVVVVGAVFQSVFGLGQPLSTAFQNLLTMLGQKVAPLIANDFWRSLLLDGMWKGVSSVLVFLPQILLLFLFIGLLEDSGYLARAALISDRTMRGVGLNGKAFIPLFVGLRLCCPGNHVHAHHRKQA